MESEIQAQGPQQQAEDSFNLRHYWHVVLERRWLVITAFITVFALTLIYLFKATPIYQATAQVQIDRDMDNILRIEGLSVGGSQDQDYLQTQYKKLRSRTVLQNVIAELKLDKDDQYKNSPDVVASLGRNIQIAPVRLSRLVDIKAEDPDPTRAAAIANKLATAYIQLNLEQKRAASLEIFGRLEKEALGYKTKYEQAQRKVQKYMEEHKQVSFEESDNIVLQALREYQARYSEAKSVAESAQKAIDEIDEMLRKGVAAQSLPFIANSSDIVDLSKQLALLNSQFAQIQKQYRGKHPTYERAVQGISSLEKAINERIQVLIESKRMEAKFARSKEMKLAELLRSAEQDQMKLKSLRIDYDVLKKEVELNDHLYKTLLSQKNETDLTGRNKINNIQVVDSANPPLRPIKPRKALTVVLAIFGGLAAGVGLAFFVNYLDDSIKSQDDVETYLKLPFLGYVPNIKTNSVVERDLQAHLHPQSNAAEGFRTIRATISLTHKAEKVRAVAVTSTIPAEGKSLVASNVAIVIAQTGLRTLLVDADLRRPSVHKAFHLHSPIGLASYLMEPSKKIEDIVHKTEVPNLDVVCCGSVPTNPSELVGSKRMVEFLEEARMKYDRVILDSPPVSAVSDPLVIASIADGILFVTKFNKIRREHARKSVQRIQGAGINIVGVVLNDIDFEGKDSYYYSYYYYQNRYYASHYKTGGKEDGKKPAPEVAAKARNGNGAGPKET